MVNVSMYIEMGSLLEYDPLLVTTSIKDCLVLYNYLLFHLH